MAQVDSDDQVDYNDAFVDARLPGQDVIICWRQQEAATAVALGRVTFSGPNWYEFKNNKSNLKKKSN